MPGRSWHLAPANPPPQPPARPAALWTRRFGAWPGGFRGGPVDKAAPVLLDLWLHLLNPSKGAAPAAPAL